MTLRLSDLLGFAATGSVLLFVVWLFVPGKPTAPAPLPTSPTYFCQDCDATPRFIADWDKNVFTFYDDAGSEALRVYRAGSDPYAAYVGPALWRHMSNRAECLDPQAYCCRPDGCTDCYFICDDEVGLGVDTMSD